MDILIINCLTLSIYKSLIINKFYSIACYNKALVSVHCTPPDPFVARDYFLRRSLDSMIVVE